MRALKLGSGTRSLLQRATVRIDFGPLSVSDHLFPMLLGLKVGFGIEPQAYLEGLRLPDYHSIVLVLMQAGYIVGTPEKWDIHPDYTEKVLTSGAGMLLNKMAEASKPVIKLQEVIGTWTRLQRELNPRPSKELVAGALRQLILTYGAEAIKVTMPEFFRWASERSKYSVSDFGRYCKQHCVERKSGKLYKPL